jgi:hypothetical protein
MEISAKEAYNVDNAIITHIIQSLKLKYKDISEELKIGEIGDYKVIRKEINVITEEDKKKTNSIKLKISGKKKATPRDSKRSQKKNSYRVVNVKAKAEEGEDSISNTSTTVQSDEISGTSSNGGSIKLSVSSGKERKSSRAMSFRNSQTDDTISSKEHEPKLMDYSFAMEENFNKLNVDPDVSKQFLKHCSENKIKIDYVDKLNDKGIVQFIITVTDTNIIQARRILKSIRSFLPEPEDVPDDLNAQIDKLKKKIILLESKLLVLNDGKKPLVEEKNSRSHCGK